MAEIDDLLKGIGQFSGNIDNAHRDSGLSRIYGAVTDTFLGFDHRATGSAYPKNTDHQGLVFFTRPTLNLSYNNLQEDRHFSSMLTDDPRSLHYTLRHMLDPLLVKEGMDDSPLVDPNQAFMPLLTNVCLTSSGWPDPTVDVYTSPEGKRQESFSFVDSLAEINNVWDLTTNFYNLVGNPIAKLFYYWIKYAGNVYMGEMTPRYDDLILNRIDYTSRVFRLTLDSNRRTITNMASTIVFPNASTMGASANFDRNQSIQDANDQVNIPMKAIGAEYDDPILYQEFNELVAIFNPAMRTLDSRINNFVKLSQKEINGFNFYGYPWINLEFRRETLVDGSTVDAYPLELEWWVKREDYLNMTRS